MCGGSKAKLTVGAVLVDDMVELAPAVRALLSDPDRWAGLSERAIRTAAEQVDWDAYVGRVATWADALPEADIGSGARAAMGAALARWLADRFAEHQSSLEELHGEAERLRCDRDRWAERADEFEVELDRVRADRDQWHQRGQMADTLAEEVRSLYGRRAVRATLRLEHAWKHDGA
jgi:hypothetical protein